METTGLIVTRGDDTTFSNIKFIKDEDGYYNMSCTVKEFLGSNYTETPIPDNEEYIESTVCKNRRPIWGRSRMITKKETEYVNYTIDKCFRGKINTKEELEKELIWLLVNGCHIANDPMHKSCPYEVYSRLNYLNDLWSEVPKEKIEKLASIEKSREAFFKIRKDMDIKEDLEEYLGAIKAEEKLKEYSDIIRAKKDLIYSCLTEACINSETYKSFRERQLEMLDNIEELTVA